MESNNNKNVLTIVLLLVIGIVIGYLLGGKVSILNQSAQTISSDYDKAPSERSKAGNPTMVPGSTDRPYVCYDSSGGFLGYQQFGGSLAQNQQNLMYLDGITWYCNAMSS